MKNQQQQEARMLSLEEMEELVWKLDNGMAAMEGRALAAERELREVRKQQQSSADGDEDECEICGSTDHTTGEHDSQDDEDESDTSASRMRDLNSCKSKARKADDTSGGDKEGRANMGAKSKLEKIVSKAATSDYRIEKCLSAVEKADYSLVTKRDFGDALNSLTNRYMSERGKTNFTKCYERVTKTAEGSRLYTGYINAPGTDIPEGIYDADFRSLANRPPVDIDAAPHQTISKIAKGQRVTRKEIEDSLDLLAASRVSKSGGSFYNEYTKLLDDPAGKVLFNALDSILRYGEI